jgi:hypothetical protein
MQRGKKYLIQVFNGLLIENEDERFLPDVSIFMRVPQSIKMF